MPKITVEGRHTVFCDEKANLLQILQEEGFHIDTPCNGVGLCGKCRVRLKESTEEREETVLACMTTLEADCSVRLFQSRSEMDILSEAQVMEAPESDFEEGYGLAVDIGTTTIAMSLYDLHEGEEKAVVSAINPQSRFGWDVLTRISYADENFPQGIFSLQAVLIEEINRLIGQILELSGLDRGEISHMAVAANTVTMHTLLGEDIRAMGRFPFTPVFVEQRYLSPEALGIHLSEKAVIYCLPSISAFIGADIAAGIIACSMQRKRNQSLLIDIGTNCEMILVSKDRIYGCSCAAGPALEGMNISIGTRAVKGAVSDVRIEDGAVRRTTIGGLPPCGICGSGMLALVKELLRKGLISGRGTFLRPDSLEEKDPRRRLIESFEGKRRFVLDEGQKLYITQGDIRQVQLAKAAISSGLSLLLEEAGMRAQDLEEVFIAGQFGYHLDTDILIRIGILPPVIREKVSYVGNVSKIGAFMALISRKLRRELADLAPRVRQIELSNHRNYESVFREALQFPENIP